MVYFDDRPESRLERVLAEAPTFLLDPKRDYKMVIVYNGTSSDVFRVAAELENRLKKLMIPAELSGEPTTVNCYSSIDYKFVPKILEIHNYSVSFKMDYDLLVSLINNFRRNVVDGHFDPRHILILNDPNNFVSSFIGNEGVYGLDVEWILGYRKSVLKDSI